MGEHKHILQKDPKWRSDIFECVCGFSCKSGSEFALHLELSDQCGRFRKLMYEIEKEIAHYEVATFPENKKMRIFISGKTAKQICKLMSDTS